MQRIIRFAPRQLALLGLLLLASGAVSARGAAQAGPGSTTVLLVRHAEKAADDPRDPSLSAAGQARAAALSTALADAEVAAVFTTQFRRTRDTAAPVAARFGLEVQQRPVSASNASTYAPELVREVLARHGGRTVLVVGHSNTVPELVAAFSGRRVESMSEDEYDRIFIVTIAPSGSARLIRATYGAPSGPAAGG